MRLILWETCRVGVKIFCHRPSNREGATVMQCDEKLRLLRIQLQALAAELEKQRQKILWSCLKWELVHVRYFNDRQCLWMDVMEQQHE